MINYYDLAPTQRTIFVALFFLALCGGIYLIFTTFRGRYRFSQVIITALVLINTAITVLYMTDIRTVKQNRVPSQLSNAFCGLPILIPILFLLACIAFYIYVLVKEIIYRHRHLTHSSIKEGLDKISSGLCFSRENGRIVLVNQRMEQLCHIMVGRDLQNAALFWDILTKGEILPEVTRITDGFNPIFRLPDGSVWTFSQKKIGDIFQLSASEITQLQQITDELTEKNVQLVALNKRLKKYGENVDKLTRSKERLDVKARIHRDLGQALLASRRYLVSETEVPSETFKLWRDNIAMLRMEAKVKDEETPMEMLSRMISATGVICDFVGEMPADKNAQKLFILAAAEALTNAISHARAKTLTITLTEDETNYIARYTNDGAVPDSNVIKEGGGLSSLRQKIENEGGEMTVKGKPYFLLTVVLTKRKGEM